MAYLFQIDNVTRHQFLHRFALDLREAGRLEVPSLCGMDISPDGSLVVGARYGFGMVTAGTADPGSLKEPHSGQTFCAVMMDVQNHIRAHDGAWPERCSAGPDPLSRHRLPCTGKSAVSSIAAKESRLDRSAHMCTEDFYHYLAKGAVPPHLPQANEQNVTDTTHLSVEKTVLSVQKQLSEKAALHSCQ